MSAEPSTAQWTGSAHHEARGDILSAHSEVGGEQGSSSYLCPSLFSHWAQTDEGTVWCAGVSLCAALISGRLTSTFSIRHSQDQTGHADVIWIKEWSSSQGVPQFHIYFLLLRENGNGPPRTPWGLWDTWQLGSSATSLLKCCLTSNAI